MAIRQAGQRFPDPQHAGRWVAPKLLTPSGGKGLIRVVYEHEGASAVTVVTFYRTFQLERYWRAE